MYDIMLHEMPIQTQARGNMSTCISMPGNRGCNFHFGDCDSLLLSPRT